MTKFLQDILDQTNQWVHCVEAYELEDYASIVTACKIIKSSQRLILCSIGASYNAGIAIQHMLQKHHAFIINADASEIQHNFIFKEGDVVLFLSRSGESVELVHVMRKCKAENIQMICICNQLKSTLAIECQLVIPMHVKFDHAISVNTYTSIILVGILLQNALNDTRSNSYWPDFVAIGQWVHVLHETLSSSDFLIPDKHYYFLARGADLSAASAAVLLWEEAAKMPAAMKTTGNFRHGAQEIVSEKLNVMMWLDSTSLTFKHDTILAMDLQRLGVTVCIVSDFEIDGIETIVLPQNNLRLLTSQVPAQILANYLSIKNQQNPDEFRYCDYIVKSEGGIIL